VSEPPTRCRKSIGDIKTGARLQSRDEPGSYLLTALAVSGIEVARARFQALVWNVGTPRFDVVGRAAGVRENPKRWTPWRGRVPMRSRRADRLIVVMKLL
jgi:hypothetical protein